ncbi:MAG: NAD(P)H-hydrate epimerase [Firmicutes bacterium]|nr:NAD(P)H-hydrate epimerase [Bacillota bacterium]
MSTFRIIKGSQAKEADRYAIEEMKIPSLTLMENASRFVADAAKRIAEADAPILICSGTGNNGADGLCAACILHEEGYGNITVVLCGDEDNATPEWKHQMEAYTALGLPLVRFDENTDINDLVPEPAVLIDALFGIGLHRPVKGLFKTLIEQINLTKGWILSVDIPSGIDSDTGEMKGEAVRADETVTFGCRKTGLCARPGEKYAGRIRIVDIDIPEEAYLHAVQL